MIVAHRVQTRRVPRNARGFAVLSAAKEKNILPRIFASTRQVLPVNDCLAWLVPRRTTRARQR
jgi:hypothetical protein